MMWTIFVGPMIGFMVGVAVDVSFPEFQGYEWQYMMISMSLSYALIFLPLISGVLASSICRYEHQSGGWKQLLTLPVTRGSVFTAKYIVVLLLVLVIQLLFLVAVYGAGVVKGLTTPFPLEIVWKSILGGWVATFPLVALQLWMSILMKNFAGPFAVNVVFTMPSILAVNSERFGPLYPWAQPFSMMYIGGSEEVFYVPWEQLLTVVGGGFLVFFMGGYLYFQRKSI